MKKILLSILCLTLFTGIYAQNFTLSYNNVNIAAGATLYFLGEPSVEIMEAHINITNNAEVAKYLNVKKVVLEGDTLPGTINSFCWGLCYPDTTYCSAYPQSVQPGVTSDLFYGDYRPHNIPGISTVTYVFFDVENTNDSVSVTVKYNASPASVDDELAGLVKFSGPYPNPAIDMVSIDYSIPESVYKASIAVTNLLGSKVMEVNLINRSGKAQIPVFDLDNGIYFYSLIADSRSILTRKFMVRR